MILLKYISGVIVFLIATSLPLSASSGDCSYSKSVQKSGTTFEIISRPAGGCAVQIVSVAVRRNGKKLAHTKVDVDYLARAAEVVDLTGDGKPELALFSRTLESSSTDALDIYWMDGSTLRRAMVPELEATNAYKRGDRFQLEGRIIVRTVPVYRYGEKIGEASGGTRTFKYEFNNGKIVPFVETDQVADTSDGSKAQIAVQSAQSVETAKRAKRVESVETVKPVVVAKPVETVKPFETVEPVRPSEPAVPVLAVQPMPIKTKSVEPTVNCRLVTEITASDAGIEIRSCAPIEKFKVLKLEKPGRMVIDLLTLDSALAGKKIAINRFGIGNVRVGRNKGFLRVVLDSTLSRLPEFEVKSSGTGILIEPIGFVESAKPAEPAKPVEPIQPAEQAKLAEAVMKVEPPKSLEAAKSVEQIQLAEPVKPVREVQSIEVAKVIESVQPVEPVQALPIETKSVVPVATVFAVTGVTAAEAGIEIGGDGPIEKFKVMKLANPERVVIDIPVTDSSLVRKTVPINRFGISNVRVGRNNGVLRIVLDTNLRTFPKYRVSSSAKGLLVEFTQ